MLESRVRATALATVALILSACSSQQTPEHPQLSALNKMTDEVSAEIAAAGKISPSGVGGPVFVLEETHSSRQSLIENAIVITRLYARYGLRDIVLEGYLQNDPKIDATWFTGRPHTTPVDRARVAVQLLKEGEISAPEFNKLVFADINLIPGEVSKYYDPTLKEGAFEAAEKLAYAISPAKGEQVSQTLEDAAKNPMSAEGQLQLAEELERDRVSMSIRLPQKTLDNWNNWLGFWRARVGGNNTMFVAVSSTGASSRPVVMNVGAAHTVGICQLLANANRPYAVISPLAFKNRDDRGKIDRNYQRKEKQQSVQSNGLFMSAINSATLKKPKPVLNAPWFQAKALSYQFTDFITNQVLGPSSPPGGGKPPYEFSADQFDDSWVRVDPLRIAIVPNDDHKAVLFPIILNPANRLKTRTFWMKAILDHHAQPSRSLQDDAVLIEAMLKHALSEVEAEADAPSQAEDEQGTISVSDNVRAVFASTREAAIAKSLRATS